MFQEKLLNFLDFSGQILQILCTPPIKVCNIPHSYNAKKYNTDKNNLKDFVPLNDFSVCSACISNAKPNLTGGVIFILQIWSPKNCDYQLF